MRAHESLNRRWTALALTATLAAFGVGCESTTPAPMNGEDPAAQTEDINARHGGYNAADEVAGYGDDYLLNDGERAIDDDMESDSVVTDLAARPDGCAYGVRIVWGYLERDSSHVNTAVDWSGSAVVDTGAVVGRRTILFEPLQGDHVVRPRPSRRVIEWVSTTTVHFDGLHLVVLDPDPKDDAGTLTIEMPLFSATYSMSELAGLDETVVVDEAGHQVRIQARKLVRPDHPEFCRHGWLAGRWERVDRDGSTDVAPEGVLGRFRGHFTTADGTVTGALRGFYGINRRGHRVLFGKMISESGRFEALMRGTWAHGDSRGRGTFVARLYDGDRSPIGATRGVWQRREDGHGTFMGGWAILCRDGESDVEMDDSIFEPAGER